MKVKELMDWLKYVDPEYRVVIGINTDYHEIDYVETDHTSDICSLWIPDSLPKATESTE